jgi:phage terminase large subunit GpA-like protein
VTATALAGLGGLAAARERERQVRATVFAPRPKLTLSQWADQYRWLSEEGKWRTSRVPYLREIMDACSDPAVEHVVVMKSARVGYTEGVIGNLIGYHIHQQPTSILVMQPTGEDAKGWSRENLDPMLEATPVLRGRVVESGRRDRKNSLRFKAFPGGSIVVVGGNSAAGLRRRSARILIGDERSGYAASAKGGTSFEGDPWALARKRTLNFWDRKIIEGSTPTVKGDAIERAWELTDQRWYYVPCPHCGHAQRLVWRNFTWEHNQPETVRYRCGEVDEATGEVTAGCGLLIGEEYKAWMVGRGTWRPTYPERPARGYRIWTAYSLLSSWARMVEEFLAAKASGKPEELQAFVNQTLGETWEEDADEVPTGTLLARRRPYTDAQGQPVEVPAWAAVLTSGTDVQGDRLEVSVWGWGPGEESGLIRHEVLWGDPGQADVWRQHDAFLARPWRHASGVDLRIRAACIDSGGHHTEQVYQYAKARRRLNVFAIRGSNQPGSAPVGRPGKGNKFRLAVFPLGTEALKDSLYSALKVPLEGPGYVHFPQVPEEYFKQLTGEVARTRYVRGPGGRAGRPVRRYERRYDRVEALDCAVYARAAFLLLGPLREQLAQERARLEAKGTKARAAAKGAPPKAAGAAPPRPPRPRPRGGWMQWRPR